MDTRVTGSLPQAPTFGHVTGHPRPVLICARALGKSAEEIELTMDGEAIERLARELAKQDGP